VLNGEGHTSPLRALTYTHDGAYVLSGGTDKVVHVWDIRRSLPRIAWSIRPPLNRRAGWVYALAAAGPLPDKTYLVAVAGYGASIQGGEISVYRLPPLKDPTSGDRVFRLAEDTEDKPAASRAGHSLPVFGLDFSADGRYLASCSQDRTIRVWDLQARPEPRSVTTLYGHTGEVTRVAFLAGDLLVSTGGANDGTLRIWNWRAGGDAIQSNSPSDPDLKLGEGVRINALAVNRPEFSQIAVGRENGRLEHYLAADLRVSRLLNPNDVIDRRPVEALAFSLDGKTLAASILKEKLSYDPTILTRTDCQVTVRPMPEGEPVREVLSAGDRVKALAFSPVDANRLAVGGGEAHAVMIKDVNAAADKFIARMPGPGTVVWKVGFVNQNPTVAFARKRPAAGEDWKWEAFDLSTGRLMSVENPEGLATAVDRYQGWSVKTVPKSRDEFLTSLIAVSPEGQEIPLRLSPDEDVRWTCYTFIPPNPNAGHSRLMIAIGSLSGITFFTLPDKQKTRILAGHAEAIYGMAPSSDGRWLVTGSADQTVRLWTLKDCDQRPALGAVFAADPQGGLAVTDLGIRSFAWEMGLRKGDRVVRCYRDEATALDTADPGLFQAGIQTIEPGTRLEFRVLRDGRTIPMQTTRRELLGAAVAAAGAGLTVTGVMPGSPSQEMGLRLGDRIIRGTKLRTIDLPLADPVAFDPAVQAVPPGAILRFDTRRGAQARPMATSRRDPPALSFFSGEKLEWILWMPEGYYHSSAEGDRELLGWHVNRNAQVATTTAFYPMSRFAAQLRKPDAIKLLLATGDVFAALREGGRQPPPAPAPVPVPQPPPVVQGPPIIVPPPTIRIVNPAVQPGTDLVVDATDLLLRIEATAGGDRKLRSVVVKNGNVPFTPRVDSALSRAVVEQVVPLHPDINPISISATDNQGVVEIQHVRVRLRPPDKPLRLASPRLVIRSFGIDAFQGRVFYPIKYAAEDATQLSEFLKAPAQRNFFDGQWVDARHFTGPQVTAQMIIQVLEELATEARSKKLGTGDTLFLVLESHVVSLPSVGSVFLGADAPDKLNLQYSVSARVVTDCLDKVASQGCMVYVLLDGVHKLETQPPRTLEDLNEWIRVLTSKGVLVFLASKQSPSWTFPADGLGVFAKAILESMSVGGQAGAAVGSSSPTLNEFDKFVSNRVLELSERNQFTGFYKPEELQPSERDRIRIFEPLPPRIEELAGRGPEPPAGPGQLPR
jgi:WD40 repeat protein